MLYNVIYALFDNFLDKIFLGKGAFSFTSPEISSCQFSWFRSILPEHLSFYSNHICPVLPQVRFSLHLRLALFMISSLRCNLLFNFKSTLLTNEFDYYGDEKKKHFFIKILYRKCGSIFE